MASAAAGGGAPKPYLYLSSLVMRAAAHAPPPTRISSVKLPPALSTLHGLPRDKPFDVTTLLLPPRLWQQQPPSRHDPATATLALRIQIAQLRRVDTSEPFAEAKALTTVRARGSGGAAAWGCSTSHCTPSCPPCPSRRRY